MSQPEEDLNVENKKQWFISEVLKSESEKLTHYNVMAKDKYQELIEEIETAAMSDRKTPTQLRRLRRFRVIDLGGIKRIAARNDDVDEVKIYLTAEELYEAIDSVHKATGHGGRDKMLAESSMTYANITREQIIMYLSMCDVCQHRKRGGRRRKVEPFASTAFIPPECILAGNEEEDDYVSISGEKKKHTTL